ncbi:unnamed protein product [Moneuplotes crassus]|uniref:Uncharacterized protein n=1 Tax=Euplotes crassus TaxID=5936 RepID=A0AAD1U6L2_EUPCR|nr:unnamed protein product [Moneuplotes crassus]
MSKSNLKIDRNIRISFLQDHKGQLKYCKNNFKILGQKFRDKDLALANCKSHPQEASAEPRDQRSERSKNIFVHGHKFQNPFYTRKMLVNLNKLAPRSFSEEKARGHQRKRHMKRDSKSFMKMNPCHSHVGSDSIVQNTDLMQETARFTFMKQHNEEQSLPNYLNERKQMEKSLVMPIFNHPDKDFELPQRVEMKEPINMKYKDRIRMQSDQNTKRKIKDVNLNIGKIRENNMIRQNLKQLYANGHHRHHSDVTGMYSQGMDFSTKNPFEVENKSRIKKQLSNKQQIIREVFSPPSKVRRRRQKVSYDSEANYGHDFTDERSFDERNYTPGLNLNGSFKEKDREIFPRNYTSEGGTVRTRFNTSETDTIQSLPGIHRQDGYDILQDHVDTMTSNKLKLVHITPNEYKKRMKDIADLWIISSERETSI